MNEKPTFDQHDQTPGSQTNIIGVVQSRVFSGEFHDKVTVYPQSHLPKRIPLQKPLRALHFVGRENEPASLMNDPLGDTSHAIEFLKISLAISREIGYLSGECGVLGHLGQAYYSLGQTCRAIWLYKEAIAIYNKTSDRNGEGIALYNLSIALQSVGKKTQAIENAKSALRSFEQIKSTDEEKVRQMLSEWIRSEEQS